MTKYTGTQAGTALCLGKPGARGGAALAKLACALLCGALLALTLAGCGGGGGVVTGGDEDTGVLAAAEATEAGSAEAAKDESADKATLYNWAKCRYPYLRGESTGLIRGTVTADFNYKQNAATGYYNCRSFKIHLDYDDYVDRAAFQMYSASGRPCIMTISATGVATITGAAYFDYYRDGQSAKIVDYKLVLTDRGNSQRPRDNVKAYCRTGSSSWILVSSFDCTYQSAYGGDLIVKRKAANAY